MQENARIHQLQPDQALQCQGHSSWQLRAESRREGGVSRRPGPARRLSGAGLPVRASPVTSGRAEPSTPAVAHRCALTRGKSLLSLHPAPRYSTAGARAVASCRRAAPMLGWGGGRALLPGMLSVVLRKQPSGFARPPSLIAEVLGRRTSPTLRKPAGTYLASSLSQGWTGPGPVISCVWSGDRGVERLYRTETVLSLYGFVPRVKTMTPEKQVPGQRGL